MHVRAASLASKYGAVLGAGNPTVKLANYMDVRSAMCASVLSGRRVGFD